MMGSKGSHEKEKITIAKSTRNFNQHTHFRPIGDTDIATARPVYVRKKDSIKIIWLDSRSVPRDDIIDTQLTRQALSNAIKNAVLTCYSDRTSCIKYLRQQENTAGILFLVVSGNDALDLFHDLNDDLYRCIDSIFIFCLSKNVHEAQLLYQKKVAGVYTEHKELLQSIQAQAVQINQQDLIMKYYSETQKTARIIPSYAKGEFVWIRALKEACLQVEKTDRIMKKMYDRFRLLYRHDANELKKIKDFEDTYCPDNAIAWYTKDSFLYRIINQGLRTQNTDELLMFSPYIADLCHALRALKAKTGRAMIFFRGSVLSKAAVNEFQGNIGSLLSINSFFSATRQRDVAKVFASCDDANGSSSLVSVLFEIEVQENTQSFFADISAFSLIKDEEEVLFDLNSVFTIHDVTYCDTDKCWIIHLIADEETYVKYDHIYTELCEEFHLSAIPTFTVGFCLILIGDTREAYRYANSLPLSYNSMSAFTLLFVVTCIIECDYARAIKVLENICTACHNSKFYEVNEGWTNAACWIADILINLGEYNLAKQYIDSVVRYYQTIKGAILSYEQPMSLEFLERLGRALQNEDDISVSYLVFKAFSPEEISKIRRAVILPSLLTRLARSYVNADELQKAVSYLQQAEVEGELLLSERSSVRLEIYIIYACINLHVEKFDQCSLYLNQAERIARMNLSRSAPSSLGCVFLIRELLLILQEDTSSPSFLPSARIAFLRTQNYIDVPKVMFVLGNLCKIHRNYRKKLHPSVYEKLAQLVKEAFEICRFEMILEGKSPENIYRPIQNYVKQLDN
ncbi:unnamed protein product [Adineta ricciae]|uniref:NAD(P)(+)--arginine ADP-ribosyltransferase n=1 Tax=Adineta ricciae TaxID=249248 RepID=A0A815AQ97_ADIRI|nr:unnamed protein product [Adineta ricciae]CAF1261125.1 unnamed protein product [Adineta ricciae]